MSLKGAQGGCVTGQGVGYEQKSTTCKKLFLAVCAMSALCGQQFELLASRDIQLQRELVNVGYVTEIASRDIWNVCLEGIWGSASEFDWDKRLIFKNGHSSSVSKRLRHLWRLLYFSDLATGPPQAMLEMGERASFIYSLICLWRVYMRRCFSLQASMHEILRFKKE